MAVIIIDDVYLDRRVKNYFIFIIRYSFDVSALNKTVIIYID